MKDRKTPSGSPRLLYAAVVVALGCAAAAVYFAVRPERPPPGSPYAESVYRKCTDPACGHVVVDTRYDLLRRGYMPFGRVDEPLDAPGYMQSSMANALGVVETCFTWAEDGVLAGTFWEQPQSKVGVAGAFTGLVNYMGNVLVTTGTDMGYDPANTNIRIYVTKNAGNNTTLMIWGLNFDETRPVTVTLALASCRGVRSAILKHYGKPGDDAAGGDTSLTTSSGMAWDQQDVTTGFNSAGFPLTLEDAEITLLILDILPMPDMDGDGDVDMGDFAGFQYCFNGANRPSSDPATCGAADFDGDADVDLADFSLFQACFNGPNQPPACT